MWLGFPFYMWRSLDETLNVFAGLGLFKNSTKKKKKKKKLCLDFLLVEPNSQSVEQGKLHSLFL